MLDMGCWSREAGGCMLQAEGQRPGRRLRGRRQVSGQRVGIELTPEAGTRRREDGGVRSEEG